MYKNRKFSPSQNPSIWGFHPELPKDFEASCPDEQFCDYEGNPHHWEFEAWDPKLKKEFLNRRQQRRNTVFENYKKCIIQHYERSELRLHFEWTKKSVKMPKMANSSEFLKTWSLRSNSVTRQVNKIRQKLVKNTKMIKTQVWHLK